MLRTVCQEVQEVLGNLVKAQTWQLGSQVTLLIPQPPLWAS